MKQEAGVWIDHRQAVIVNLSDQGEIIQHIRSNIPGRIRFSGASHAHPDSRMPHDDAAEDIRDHRFNQQLNRYYDQIIAALNTADSILVMGPGEAKIEFQHRFADCVRHGKVVAVETRDKLTDPQIASMVRKHFQG